LLGAIQTGNSKFVLNAIFDVLKPLLPAPSAPVLKLEHHIMFEPVQAQGSQLITGRNAVPVRSSEWLRRLISARNLCVNEQLVAKLPVLSFFWSIAKLPLF